jgi:hypothetical protein
VHYCTTTTVTTNSTFVTLVYQKTTLQLTNASVVLFRRVTYYVFMQDYGARVPVEMLYADEMTLVNLVPLVKAGGMPRDGTTATGTSITGPIGQSMQRDAPGGCESWLTSRYCTYNFINLNSATIVHHF